MTWQRGDQSSFVMQTADVKYMYFDKLFQLEVKNKFIVRCQKTFSWTEKVCMAVKTYFFLQNTLVDFLNVNLYWNLEFLKKSRVTSLKIWQLSGIMEICIMQRVKNPNQINFQINIFDLDFILPQIIKHSVQLLAILIYWQARPLGLVH